MAYGRRPGGVSSEALLIQNWQSSRPAIEPRQMSSSSRTVSPARC